MFKVLSIVMFMVSCGGESVNLRKYEKTEFKDKYKVLGRIEVNTKVNSNYGVTASSSTTVTYTVAEAAQFTIDTGSLSPVESSETLLDFGSVSISQLKVNKLKQCGVSGTEKCTSAIIRIYTTEVTGHSGISGFVNKTDAYGIEVKAGETTASTTVGLTVANAAVVDSYTIPASDKKLTSSDFSGVVYEVEGDFSNAGFGDYEMNLVIELGVM